MSAFSARSSSLRVLLADDDVAICSLVKDFLEGDGYEVTAVGNGMDAMAAWKEQPFDLCILDVVMPGLNGVDVCQHIKSAADGWVPVILFSGNKRERDQIVGMDGGADYYVVKPISFPLLKATLHACQRTMALYSDLESKNAELQQFYNQSVADNDLALDIIQRIAHSEGRQSPNAQHIVNPAGDFSGDIIVSVYSLSQRYYSFIADATGHGLPAAITLLPAVSMFYRLAKEGYGVGTITYELNRRLRESLPRDRFVAGTVVMIEPRQNRLEIWNGGCPPAFLVNRDNRAIDASFTAQHPPLGMLEPEDFQEQTQEVFFSENQKFVACTDGVIEAQAPDGGVFGVARFKQVLTDPGRSADLAGEIRRALKDFSHRDQADDDQTLLVLPLKDLLSRPTTIEERSPGCGIFPEDGEGTLTNQGWEASFRILGQSIRDTEILPLVNNMLGELGLSGKVAERTFVCLTELINNAVDHGILKLQSCIKAEADGVEKYFLERQSRLDAVQSGEISVRASMVRRGEHKVLLVDVEDSGDGFDTSRISDEPLSGADYCGRGIAMIQQLADGLLYENGGTKAHFEMRLEQGAERPSRTDI